MYQVLPTKFKEYILQNLFFKEYTKKFTGLKLVIIIS